MLRTREGARGPLPAPLALQPKFSQLGSIQANSKLPLQRFHAGARTSPAGVTPPQTRRRTAQISAFLDGYGISEE